MRRCKALRDCSLAMWAHFASSCGLLWRTGCRHNRLPSFGSQIRETPLRLKNAHTRTTQYILTVHRLLRTCPATLPLCTKSIAFHSPRIRLYRACRAYEPRLSRSQPRTPRLPRQPSPGKKRQPEHHRSTAFSALTGSPNIVLYIPVFSPKVTIIGQMVLQKTTTFDCYLGSYTLFGVAEAVATYKTNNVQQCGFAYALCSCLESTDSENG
jgi:hypothetical protein